MAAARVGVGVCGSGGSGGPVGDRRSERRRRVTAWFDYSAVFDVVVLLVVVSAAFALWRHRDRVRATRLDAWLDRASVRWQQRSGR